MASSTTSITSAPDPSVCGQDVVFTAIVSPVPPETATPTGTVTFIVSDDGPSIVVPLDGAGQAQAVFSGLGVGVHQAVAVYSGDGTFDPSSSPLDNHTVNLADSTTTVVADPNPSVCGEPVELCAVVVIDSPGIGIPTGTVTFTGPGGLNQTATLDVAGEACITTAVLSDGTVTATYDGDDCASGSIGTVTVAVDPAPTTTVVTAEPDPSVCGEFVEICAVVTVDPPGAGLPTGTVTFTGPGGLNQTVTLDNTGQACLTYNLLATGTITATYNGDACAATSTGTVGVTVNPADSTTAVSADPDPSVCGQSVEICAVVTPTAPSSSTPTGTVTFTGPGGLNQTVTLGGGQACLNTTALATGTVTATYNGSPCHNGSVGTTTVTVEAADTTTDVTATPDPSVCGQSVTVCATVAVIPPGGGTPTGSVTFTGPGGFNQTVALDGMGQACLTTTALATGTVVATYNGAACFNSSSDTVAVTVNPAASTTVVSADPNPSVCGQSVEICALVTTNPPGSGTPTGSVIFTGPGGLNQTVALDVTGEACLTTTSLATGTVVATYTGDACHTGSTGTFGVTVDPAETTTVVTADPDPSVCGESVEICATVTTDPPGSGTPTGSVIFTGPGGLNQTVPLNGAGQACLTTTVLADGTVTATYNGESPCFAGSVGTVTVTVDPADTTTTVSADPNPSVCGESVEICALVTTNPPGSGVPTGTVTFTGPGGLNQTVALDGAGEACITTSSLTDGTVTAVYNGDACHNTSTGTLAITVNPAATTTVVTADPNPSVCGQSVEICALVTIDAPGSGTPTGTVTFTGPGGLNQTVPLDGTGEACLTTTSLATGTVTATYNGDACAATSTGTVTVTVNPAATTTVVTAEPDPSVCGESVEICATVTTNAPGSGTPTGTVTFTGPGGLNQTATLNGAGQACLTTTVLADGTVTATYNGESPCFAGSVGTVTVTVDPGDTTTTVSADPNPSVCGESVEICALVTTNPPGSGTPTGTVTFTGPGGLNQTVPLNGAGEACITTSSLTDGTVTAVYNGDACHNTSTGTVAVTVDPADTTTTVSADPNPSVCGESVEICALVTTNPPGSGTPTGTVTFTGPGGLNQTVPLDGAGEACITTSSLTDGTVTAVYNGDACHNTSTGTLAITVDPAATTTVVSADPNPSVCGQSVEICALVTIDEPGSGTPTGTVTFTGPGGLNQTVPLDGSGEACLTTTSLATGTVTATYNGDPCAATSTGTVTVTVNPAATSTAVSVTPNPSVCGQSVTVCATVTTNPPGSGIPTGTVTFTGPGGLNQTVALNGAGEACLTTTVLATGTVTATYNGDSPCFAGSVGTAAVTVNPANTTTTVSAFPNPSVCGQSVTVCATVDHQPARVGHPDGHSHLHRARRTQPDRRARRLGSGLHHDHRAGHRHHHRRLQRRPLPQHLNRHGRRHGQPGRNDDGRHRHAEPVGVRPVRDGLRHRHHQPARIGDSDGDSHLHRARRTQPDRHPQRRRPSLPHHDLAGHRHHHRRLQRRRLPQHVDGHGRRHRECGRNDDRRHRHAEPVGVRPVGGALRRRHHQRTRLRRPDRHGHLHRTRGTQPDRRPRRHRRSLLHHHRPDRRHGHRHLQRRESLLRRLRRHRRGHRRSGTDVDGGHRHTEPVRVRSVGGALRHRHREPAWRGARDRDGHLHRTRRTQPDRHSRRHRRSLHHDDGALYRHGHCHLQRRRLRGVFGGDHRRHREPGGHDH